MNSMGNSAGQEAPRIRALLVDDFRFVIHILTELLERLGRFDVVGVAHSGTEGVRLATELEPDLVLLDLNMPGLNGLDVTRTLCKADHTPKIVMITLDDDARFHRIALEAGAAAFCSKLDLDSRLPEILADLFPET